MTSVIPKFEKGPVTYEVASAVTGGRLVQARTDGKIEHAAAGSTKVLGVASRNARPFAESDQSGTTVQGYPYHDASVGAVTPHVAVYKSPYIVPVAFAAAAAFGAALKAAADGRVTPWITGTDPADLIIGYSESTVTTASTDPNGLVKLTR